MELPTADTQSEGRYAAQHAFHCHRMLYITIVSSLDDPSRLIIIRGLVALLMIIEMRAGILAALFAAPKPGVWI